jgi:hypothetical protein
VCNLTIGLLAVLLPEKFLRSKPVRSLLTFLGLFDFESVISAGRLIGVFFILFSFVLGGAAGLASREANSDSYGKTAAEQAEYHQKKREQQQALNRNKGADYTGDVLKILRGKRPDIYFESPAKMSITAVDKKRLYRTQVDFPTALSSGRTPEAQANLVISSLDFGFRKDEQDLLLSGQPEAEIKKRRDKYIPLFDAQKDQ